MKKRYITIAVIIEALLLVAFVLGGGLYTYVLANGVIKERMSKSKDNFNFMLPSENYEYNPQAFIQYVITWHWDYVRSVLRPDQGFYGYIELTDGTTLDTSSPLGYVQCSEDSYIDYDEVRILRVDGPIDEFAIEYNPEFDAECDDIFIYGGTVTTFNGTYQLGTFDCTGYGERTTVSEWAQDVYLYCPVLIFAKTYEQDELNREAQELFAQVHDAIINGGDSVELEKEDIRTSYCIVITDTSAGRLYDMCLFHPVQIAVTSHIGTYVVMLLALLVIGSVIAVAFVKSYKTRVEYEMRSRRLTRGIAHELKTPLAVAKAYMENWEYIDEKDRPEYADKINKEVDDMAEFISILLEMDKLDSGKIKLNLEEVELVSLIKSVYKRVEPLAKERDLEVTIDALNEHVIKADLRLMRIAVGNYLTNMVKYADKEAHIKIGVNGYNVRAEFRNDSENKGESKTDKLNSNGMGLEINENIMKIHGFKCGSSMRKHDTMFWFEAPVNE